MSHEEPKCYFRIPQNRVLVQLIPADFHSIVRLGRIVSISMQIFTWLPKVITRMSGFLHIFPLINRFLVHKDSKNFKNSPIRLRAPCVSGDRKNKNCYARQRSRRFNAALCMIMIIGERPWQTLEHLRVYIFVII